MFNNFQKEPNKNIKVLIAVTAVIILAVVFLIKINIFNSEEKNKGILINEEINTTIPEIEAIKATQVLNDQIKEYEKLIERVGPLEAQEALYRSGLPFTGQTHLLNHIVGDYLYDKLGSAGLVQCRDYFLSSCYHGFILNAIADGGMDKIEETFGYCRKEGDAISSQCAHAIGHGFLASGGYKNLPKALKTCDEAVEKIEGFQAFNCYDGVFMENIWAVHDGEPSPDRWVKKEDVFYPCNDGRIDEKYLLGCWSNQPSLAYQLLEGDIKKIGSEVCGKVLESNLQEMCFDGLARQIHPITQGSATKTIELCSLMPNEKWNNFCVTIIAGASYSVGDRSVPFEICGTVNEEGKENCYSRVIAMMSAYRKPGENLKELCSQISDNGWQEKCKNSF